MNVVSLLSIIKFRPIAQTPGALMAMSKLKILACVLAEVLPAASCLAQTWPNAPLRYIVPFPPGGSTDIISRQLGERLRERLGQPVVIENIGGAGSAIGVSRVAKATPDGYTIGLGNTASHTIIPFLSSTSPYDPVADFSPISIINEYVNVLVVHPKIPVSNVRELVALNKSRVGGLTYASSGNGASNHLSAELLARVAYVRMTHVPYKGGPLALVDVRTGQVDYMFDTIIGSMAMIKSGSLRALATTGRTRDPYLPKVPAVAEFYPGYEVAGFMAVFGPAGMPKAVIDRLNSELATIIRSPEMTERLTQLYFNARTSTPDELSQRVRKDGAHWKALIASAGIKLN